MRLVEPSHFGGEILIPAGEGRPSDRILFFVRVAPDDAGPDGARAWLTIPSQGVDEVELRVDAYRAGSAEFELASVGAHFSWAPAGRDFACRFVQSGAELPCELERLEAADYDALRTPPRPQTPVGPFPYGSVEMQWHRPADPGRPETEARFAGTLTLPPGPGPHPAVLLISGSGTQDRDETIMWHKPFWVLADALTRAGVAVLRVDDRGAGASTGAGDVDAFDLAKDAVVALRELRGRAEVDPARVGILGHSEGGLIGAMVAAEDAELAFLVLLAGPGLVGRELLTTQQRALGEAAGVPDAQLEQSSRLNEAIYDALAELEPGADAEGLFAPIVDAWIRGLPELDRPDNATRAALVERLRAEASTRWFRVFLRIDPAEFLGRTRCPVLALNGTRDLQVVHPNNAEAIDAALRAGGNSEVEVVALEGLNHLFQRAPSGRIEEYARIESTMEVEVLERIATFVRRHSGLEGAGGEAR